MGDLAVRRVLDAVEAAQGMVGDDFYTRVTMSHLGLIEPTDLPRFKELGIIANYTPWWFNADENNPERISLGEERFGRMVDLKTLFDLISLVSIFDFNLNPKNLFGPINLVSISDFNLSLMKIFCLISLVSNSDFNLSLK